MPRPALPAVTLLALLLPATALANAGTPLLLGTAAHLLIGNALIGLLEGLLVGAVFKAKKLRAIAVMVLANYFSATLGALAEEPFADWLLGDTPLARARLVLAALVVLAYLGSLVLEFPFVLLALGAPPPGTSRLRRAVRACLLSQTASYALLLPWFAVLSVTSLLSLRHDPAVASDSPSATVYFLSPDTRSLLRVRLDGSPPERLAEVPAASRVGLFPKLSADSTQWDLWLAQPDSPGEPQSLLWPAIARAVPGAGPAAPIWDQPWQSPRPDLRVDPASSPWLVRLPYPYGWAAEGMAVTRRETKEKLHLALEAPGLMWRMSAATVLPNDRVVLELRSARPQIAILDFEGRRAAQVALGSSPVVTWDGAIPVHARPPDRERE